MFENLLLLNDNHFNSLLEIIINEEINNEPDFNSIKNFCDSTPLYEIRSNLLQIKFDELHKIHSKIIPKNILWVSIVDNSINQNDFKYNYHQIIKNVENINFEKFVFNDVMFENYRMLFHFYKDKLSDDFVSVIIVIKGFPDDPTDIINVDISNVK
jgi:hypothetical protein